MECKICGIAFWHGENDYSYWDGFVLSEEEENVIAEILMRHDAEGCSVRGAWESIFRD